MALHFLHTTTNFATLAALRGGPEAEQTKRYYVPGWEAASLEMNPELASVTRVPQAAGVHTGAVDLAAERPAWPGVSATLHRGAFLPGADGSEVGKPA